jgi:hypothetical protein
VLPAGYRLDNGLGDGFTINALPGISNDVNFFDTQKAVIYATLFYDANDDGIRESNEVTPPNGYVGGYEIELFTPRVRLPIATMLTDNAGNVTFNDLRPGAYYVKANRGALTTPESVTVTVGSGGVASVLFGAANTH